MNIYFPFEDGIKPVPGIQKKRSFCCTVKIYLLTNQLFFIMNRSVMLTLLIIAEFG
jgi:hypothetical protein